MTQRSKTTTFPVTIGGRVYRILPMVHAERLLEWGAKAMCAKPLADNVEAAGARFRQIPCAASLGAVAEAVGRLRDALEELILAYTPDIPRDALREIDLQEQMAVLAELLRHTPRPAVKEIPHAN